MIELSEQEKEIIRRWAKIVIHEYSEDGFLPISLEQRAERQIARGILLKMGEMKTTRNQVKRQPDEIKRQQNNTIAIVKTMQSEGGYCSVVACPSGKRSVKAITIQYPDGDQYIELCDDCWKEYQRNADANGITLTYPNGEGQ